MICSPQVRKKVLPLIAAALAGAASANAGVFSPETFALENGMQVVVVSNHRVPVVAHMVWYQVGSADEKLGESGIAHFLEHLMFKGTKIRAPGEFSEVLARNGGQENAFTSTDYTAYYQTVAIDHLELVMEMEADRMTNLVITPNEVELERHVVLEERRSRTENQPSSILAEQVNAALFINYPYRNPVIGWEHDIRAIEMGNIRAFYDRWYAPNNAILVVAGDITVEELKPLAEKYYGQILRRPSVSHERTKEPPQKAARRVVLRDHRVRQPVWQRSYIAPAVHWGGYEHVYPLEVLASILGGGASSRLYRVVVIDRRLAISAGADYFSDTRGPGRFKMWASPRPGISMQTLEQVIEAEIAKFIRTNVDVDELKRAKDRLQVEAIYARDSLSAGARTLGLALSIGKTVDEVESWPERIGAVRADQIKAAAETVFRDAQSVTGLLLPSDGGQDD